MAYGYVERALSAVWIRCTMFIVASTLVGGQPTKCCCKLERNVPCNK